MKLVPHVTPNVVLHACNNLDLDPDDIARPGVTHYEDVHSQLVKLHMLLDALTVPDHE